MTEAKRSSIIYKLCAGIWAGGYPGRTAIQRLTSQGVVAYIDLTRWDEQWVYAIEDYGELLPQGAKRLRFPLWTYWLPSPAKLLEIVRMIEDNVPCYIHCRQGIDRTGVIAALVLIHRGMDLDDALSHLRRARGVDSPRKSYHLKYLRRIAPGVKETRAVGPVEVQGKARTGHE